MKLGYKIFLSVLMTALLLNAALPLFQNAKSSKKEIAYEELSKILGEKVVICSDSNDQKFFVSSFERLSQEQHQHLKNIDDIKKNSVSTASAEQNIENKFYVTLNLKEVHGVFTDNDSVSDDFLKFYKLSQAPPALS